MGLLDDSKLIEKSFRKMTTPLALMGTPSFPAPPFGQERYSGQQTRAKRTGEAIKLQKKSKITIENDKSPVFQNS